MELKCLQVLKKNGVEITQFNPTPAMRLYALSAICDPEFANLEPEVVCKAIGLTKNSYKSFLQYEPYFSEWIEEVRLALGGKNKKRLLEMVGMERALAGEFNFWKPLAIREGVINPDTLNVGAAIPANLGALKGMNEQQLSELENSVMATLRSSGEPGEIAMVEGASGWEPEGDSGGAPEVPRSVVLDDELGSDGERALGELERF